MGILHDLNRQRVTATDVVDAIKRARMATPHRGGPGVLVTQGASGSVTSLAGNRRQRNGWLGIVRADGGSPGLTYSDARYYIDPAYIEQSDAPTDLPAAREETDEGANFDHILTAWNLAEALANTHLLPAGTPVWYWAEPDERGVDRYLLDVTPAPFDAKITGATRDGTNWRWTYTFEEIEKTAAGFTGWTTKTGGRTGNAYNRTEYINGASGTLGNGVVVADLEGTLAPQRAPNNLPVRMDVVGLTTGGSEFWFSYENGITGDCA